MGAYYDYFSTPSLPEMRLEGHANSLNERVASGESFTKTWKVANTGEGM